MFFSVNMNAVDCFTAVHKKKLAPYHDTIRALTLILDGRSSIEQDSMGKNRSLQVIVMFPPHRISGLSHLTPPCRSYIMEL